MNETHIGDTLRDWQRRMKECEALIRELSSITCPGSEYGSEGPLFSAVYDVMTGFTESVAEIIGWDAHSLSDWWTDHDFGGARHMIARLPGEQMREIRDIDDLIAFVIDDIRQERARTGGEAEQHAAMRNISALRQIAAIKPAGAAPKLREAIRIARDALAKGGAA